MKKIHGYVLTLCSIFLFSLEIYGLKIIQALERISGSSHSNPFSYILEPVILIAFLINFIMLFVGVVTILNNFYK